MSSSDRRSFLVFLGLGLAGSGLAACGFTPAYAPGGPAATLQGAVRVDDPTDKNAFDLVERLEERLGRPQGPRYALSYTIETSPVGAAITPENAITRYNLTGKIDFALTDIGTGATLTRGQVNSFTSYSATGSTVSTVTAAEDAAFRLMRILADQIVSRLLATSGQWSAPPL